jgi:hypothetical protein
MHYGGGEGGWRLHHTYLVATAISHTFGRCVSEKFLVIFFISVRTHYRGVFSVFDGMRRVRRTQWVGVLVSASHKRRECDVHDTTAHKLCLSSPFEVPSHTEITSSCLLCHFLKAKKTLSDWLNRVIMGSQVPTGEPRMTKMWMYFLDIHYYNTQSSCRIMSAQHKRWCNYDGSNYYCHYCKQKY